MNNLFSLENPLMRFLARVFDMIVSNALFLICCVPVVTAGAAIAALNKVTQGIVLDRDFGTIRLFFRAFRENFKQATAAFLVLLLIFLSLACNTLLVMIYLTGTLAVVLKGVLFVLAVLVLAVAVYLFPLMTRYDNALREHVKNAMILAVAKLPRTVVMVLVTSLPVLVPYFSLPTFFQTLPFFFIIGFAFMSYVSSQLLVPVFRELEGDRSEGVVFLGKVGVGISAEDLCGGRFDEYDRVFLVLDQEDRFDGETVTLPEAPCVSIRFRGGHAEARTFYERLLSYIRENDLEVAGFSREITMVDYGLTSDTEKFVTEISIPVTGPA